MNKTKTSLCVLLWALFALNAFPQGIGFFEGDFASLKEKAAKENKMIFIDCYTTWCGPCKWMVKNVFPNDTVGNFYNSNFICSTMDMEKGEGLEIAKKYEVQCYPTYLFIDSAGNLVYRASGGLPVSSLVDVGKDALDPEKNYSALKDKYVSGTISKSELLIYMGIRKKSCLGISEEKEEYFSMAGEIKDSTDWKIVIENGVDLHSKTFEMILAQKESFYKRYPEKEVNEVIFNSYFNVMVDLIYSTPPDTEKFLTLRSEIAGLALSNSECTLISLDVNYFSVTQNWKKYTPTTIKFVENCVSAGEYEYLTLNDLAWNIYLHSDDSLSLQKALIWSKRSVEQHEDYFNLDTYASLLYKTGNKDEALNVALEAIDIAKKSGQECSNTEELVRKMRGE